MKKILITGFMHSGTSILKSIIGHIPEVHEVYNEAKEVFLSSDRKSLSYHHPYHQGLVHESISENKKFILCKEPHLIEHIYNDKYKDYIIILIIRNPLWVFSSMNRRAGAECNADLPFYKKAVEIFSDLQVNNKPNIYTIKYEDLFHNNYKNLRLILDSIGLRYSNDIFDNTKYKNHIADWVNTEESLKNAPNPRQHEAFRTYQINQPFVNNNTPNKINIPLRQLNYFKSNPEIVKLYPEILKYQKISLF